MIVRLDLVDDGEEIERAQNLFYQSQVSRRVSKQMTDVVNLLTRALNIHLNLEQQFTLNTSNIFISLETLKGESLIGKEIQSVHNARLHLLSSSCLSFSLSSSVNMGTVAFVWFFVAEHQSVSIDFFHFATWRRKRNPSSYRFRSSI
jgi:hypothetical protein